MAAWLTGWQRDGPSPGYVSSNNEDDFSKQICAHPAEELIYVIKVGLSGWPCVSHFLSLCLWLSDERIEWLLSFLIGNFGPEGWA